MKTLTLNKNVEMPILGYGVYQITQEECERCVQDAINTGYRLIDTAQVYGNEKGVGQGIKHCGVAREELFITTKVWFKSFEKNAALASVFESIQKLDVDYLDLVLLHWPFGNTYAAWRVLEELYQKGTIRAIGVSNYAPSQLIDLIHFNKIVPAINQIETNLLAQQWELNERMNSLGVIHQAYAPLGQGRANEMFERPEVLTIAEKYNKTSRQIALRFLVQRGIAVIPKTTHIERMRENIDIFDFELDDTEMQTLKTFDTGKPMIGNPQSPELTKFAMTW